MSRIGKLLINIPTKVEVSVSPENIVTVKGPLGTLSREVNKDIVIKIEDGKVHVERPTDEKNHRAMHGLYRALINNMVIGVSEGYTIKQELVGVGYKATNTGQILELALGYSHEIHFQLPDEIKVETVTERRSNPIITLKSIDKELIGKVAAKIRSLRKPEPYKGKGIKFVGEVLRKKAGKAAGVK
ncbi:MAG TPA: 50S ribosomal protein L6 [Bacteroidales bacterium]|nr:MAG: 50S ribosomal protein L6 [Bacteroidetes bacterium GWF2_33_38]OFY76419.1 MAG: 50S ribosomal protein L6 [Bacteroidetes bacterium RIFOXYA12_FULL_33_9]OFY90338.1 MAG: 50S ribosomal protein L6 [Bacteroidetes bacterium RIFOXYA2_FULL_33_7]HBF88167.1 50S ribosomal protein L6 [Bacteroidales bacterium]